MHRQAAGSGRAEPQPTPIHEEPGLETNRLNDHRRTAGPRRCVPAVAARLPGGLALLGSPAAALALAIAALVPLAQARADDNLAGRRLAATCANCHGTDGRSQGAIPALAGYPADRLVATLADFKSGRKPATIMHQIAKGYTDAQIASIAAYFAAQRN